MKIRRNWWKSTRIIVRIGENYYKSIRITFKIKKNKTKEIKTWRDREREKVFPRNEVRGSALDSLFVVVVVAIISILTRPSPREKKNSPTSPSFALFSLYAWWRSSKFPRSIDGGCRRESCCYDRFFNDCWSSSSAADDVSSKMNIARDWWTVTAYCEDTRWMTTIPRFFVEIRRSFENFLLKMTIYMHSASQFPVFVVSVVRSLGFLRQKKISTRIKGDARFFIVDAL